jgi:IPT/TIG domain
VIARRHHRFPPARALALLASLALIASGIVAAGARAAVVTVGSPLAGTVVSGKQPYNETVVNLALEGPGAHPTSPVSGAIVSWHLLGFEGGPFALRVLRPVGSTAYSGVGSSSPVVAAGPALQTFAADLPIKAGDTLGLDATKGSKVGLVTNAPLSAVAAWSPTLPEGATLAYDEGLAGGEFTFDAEVQPAPTIATFAPSSDPGPGGTAVTIAGTDFEGATAVDFGTTPAVSCAVDSESQITAVAPAVAAGAVPITVTTIAGTATSGGQFTYPAPATSGPEQSSGPGVSPGSGPAPAPAALPTRPATCTVPKLQGQTLAAAKAKLKGADCRLGKVTKPKGAKAKGAKSSARAPGQAPSWRRARS